MEHYLKKIYANIICLCGASLSPSFTKIFHRYAKICIFSLSPTKNSTGFGKIELENIGKVSLIIRICLIWRSEKAKTEKNDFKIIYLPKLAYDYDKYANFGRFCFHINCHTWSFPMSGWRARMEITTCISDQNKC